MRIRASQYVFAGIQSMTSATRAAATVSSMPAASAMWAMSPDALARSRPDGSGVGSESPERTSVSRSATLRAVSRPQIVPFRVPSTGSFSLVGEIPHRERGDLFIYLFVYGSVTGDRPQRSTVQIHAPLPIGISRQMNNLTAFSFAAMAVSCYDRAPHTPAPHSAVITAQIGPFPRKIDPFPQKPTCL